MLPSIILLVEDVQILKEDLNILVITSYAEKLQLKFSKTTQISGSTNRKL